MNEENENQPAPLETESASPEQRHHRPRRRFPTRRIAVAIALGGVIPTNRRILGQRTPITPAPTWRSRRSISPPRELPGKLLKAGAKTPSRFKANRSLVKALSKSPAKDSAFCAIRNGISCRRHRTFLSRRKL